MASELEELKDQQANEEQSYEDAFEEFASGKEQEAVEEREEEASTSEQEETPSSKAPDEDRQERSSQGTSNESDDDWISKLPEEFREQAQALRENYDKRENEYRAQVGRVRSLQERLDEERARRAAAASASQPNQQSAKTPEAEANEELPEELEKLRKEYPDLYKVVKTMSSHEINRVMPQIEEKINPLSQREAERAHQENLRKFSERASDILKTDETGVTYTEVFASDEYADFLSEQPEYVQRMARTSTDPDEAAWILEQYVKAERIKYLESNRDAAPEKNPTKDRRKQLERNVSPRSKSAVADGSEADTSYEDYFNHFASNS